MALTELRQQECGGLADVFGLEALEPPAAAGEVFPDISLSPSLAAEARGEPPAAPAAAPPREEVLAAIREDRAEFLGQGGWNKDSAYQAYEYAGRCYAIIISDPSCCWLEEHTLEEIPRSEIELYVDLK